jgi:hypothetical protein
MSTEMDPIFVAKLARANDTLSEIIGFMPNSERRSAAFVEVAKAMALNNNGDMHAQLKLTANPETRKYFEKAAPTSLLGDFDGVDGAAIAGAFAESLAPASILDACLKFSKVLPVNVGKVLVATGAIGSVIAEAEPRIVADAGISVQDCPPHEVSAILVFTEEALQKGAAAAQALFDTELRSAIVRALNAEMLAALDTSSTTTIASTGDAAKDLRAALAAADPATGYVFTAPGNTIATIAIDPANRGAGVRGGEFVPGVWLVADDAITEPTLIPASNLVLQDEGLRLEPPARHASVNLAASPTSPSALVSLWQTGTIGLLALRSWRMNTDRCTTVKVTG